MNYFYVCVVRYNLTYRSIANNSMFAGNEHGAQRVALFYSLIESCKLNGIDPYTYLNDIYDRLHDWVGALTISVIAP
jgi:hypothetical protein